MPCRSSQLPSGLRMLAAAALALSLGGCFARDAADTTGSIRPTAALSGSDADLRRDAEAWGRRVEANPSDPDAAIGYARVLRARGQIAQAVAVLQQGTLRSPNHPPILAAYGKALADAGRFKEAADVLSRAHRPERPDWRILSVQGAVADQMGQFANAQRYYEAALRIAPGEPSVLSNQGLSFALAKRLDDAERVLREAAQNPRADERVRQNLAVVQGLRAKAAASPALARRAPAALPASESAAARRVPAQPDSWRALRRIDDAGGSREAALRGTD